MRIPNNVLFAPGLFLLCLLVGATAQATPSQIVISGTVLVDGTGVVGAGSPFDLNLFVDSETPNESALPDTYLATNPGTVSSFLVVAVTGTITDITSDTTGPVDDFWDSTGNLDALGLVLLPYTVSVTGLGLTPEQIMPDFTGPIAGQIVVDVTPLAGLIALVGPEVVASVDGIQIIDPIPEPSTALLLGMGIAALAANRQRRPCA